MQKNEMERDTEGVADKQRDGKRGKKRNRERHTEMQRERKTEMERETKRETERQIEEKERVVKAKRGRSGKLILRSMDNSSSLILYPEVGKEQRNKDCLCLSAG